MSDNETTGRAIPAWVWGVIAIVAVGAVAVLATSGRRDAPPQSFRYDVAEYEQVDPALVAFEETGQIKPDLPNPRALAVGPDGRVYVAGEDAVGVYDAAGAEVARFSVTGAPNCLAVAPDGDILLGMETHVEVLDGDGKPKAKWAQVGERAFITSIVAGAEEVYVADAGNRVVLRLDREGRLLQRLGEENAARDIPGFVVPSPYFDVTFDNNGALWAVNPGRHGLEQYRDNGDLVTSWYKPSMDVEGFCGCCNPAHVAFRSDGSLVTAEKGIARVKLYGPDWTFKSVVAPPEVFLDQPTGAFEDELKAPIHDLAVDAADRILVLDARKSIIRIFEEKGRG